MDSHDTYGTKALNLIVDSSRNSYDGFVPPYNKELVKEVLDEMSTLFEENREAIPRAKTDGRINEDVMLCIHVRHAALEWNRRCLVSYHHSRLEAIKEFRWQFGQELPKMVANNLSEEERLFFNKYSANLGLYMKRLNNNNGMDLTVGYKPPKSRFIKVRCVKDFGEHELPDGSVVVLNKGNFYFLPRAACEKLIQMGVLEQSSD